MTKKTISARLSQRKEKSSTRKKREWFKKRKQKDNWKLFWERRKCEEKVANRFIVAKQKKNNINNKVDEHYRKYLTNLKV